MGRRPTVESLALRDFAVRKGCTIQWARRLRKAGDQEWLDFVAGRTPAGDCAPVAACVVQDPGSDYERALASKQMAWENYVRANDLARAAFGRADAREVLPSLQRAAAEARKAYEQARDHEFRVAQETGRFVPLSNVEAMRGVVAPLAEFVQNLRTKVSGRLPVEMRAAFLAAFDSEAPAWNAGVMKLEEAFESLVPHV